MAFSVAETIKQLVHEVQRIKKEDLISPVTVISPNVSLLHSINRCFLKSDQPFLNIRIGTFYQFVKRHAEPGFQGHLTYLYFFAQGQRWISRPFLPQ
ncbi:MAG: hypothetical protein B6I30_05740 [Desulfobacteraceae bacterium 4572_187]|nr:MAG: hypothetical protein B6I30_05740 [Desulfobacteraceae bacterium 4572_187]